MADCESDLETDGLDLALETLCNRYCKDVSSLNSKGYCAEFCELVEEYTGQWQVPLPQLKVLRTALCSFTKATAVFPDDCQHILYVLSSLAMSFFELLLFFGKDEYGEEPLKDILDCFLECHSQLLRHRNVYFQHVKQTIKTGGPWENPVLKGIIKEADMPRKQVEDYLSSELLIFLELRVRYLQACERMQEAMALAKSCLENRETGNHLFFHQAYLTCLYKASLHEHLLKEMAEIDGHDAVEIICNTESVEKDELLLSLCKTFLTQQLHNGDMYYIWDLVFIWSRLYLRAHPSREGFHSECLLLASSATNVRAIFPFIKLVNTELGEEGIQVCVELCARALQLCDMHSDSVTQSLVCKTIAFLLPHDLEICRACALLVFCQERSLEAYRTVCLLYMHPDDEPHPCNTPVKTSVRFHILQKLKGRLCFDPEFWNLLTLRTHCLELMSDKVMQAAVLTEMEEEEQYCEALTTSNRVNDPATECSNPPECTDIVSINLPDDNTDGDKVKPLAESDNVPTKRKWRRQQTKKELLGDEEIYPGDDPEVIYNLNPTCLGKATVYSLRRHHKNRKNAAPVKFPYNRQREYLTRCVKSQILKRKGHSKRWLQGVQTLDPEEAMKLKRIMYKGKKRGRKPLSRFELSFPDNEIELVVESDSQDKERVTPEILSELEATRHEQIHDETVNDLVCSSSGAVEQNGQSETSLKAGLCDNLPKEAQAPAPAVEANPELDGPLLDLLDCPVAIFHNYFLNSNSVDEEPEQPEEPTANAEQHNACSETEPSLETEETKPKIKGKSTWKEKLLRAQKYSHLSYQCTFCHKEYKGLNVMRHALSHMKKKHKCILCGKRIKQFFLAKKHIMDHIDEMSKQKPSNDKEQETDSDKQTPTTNGMGNQNSDPNEQQTTVPKEETPVKQKPPARSKLADLKREERIIRNLRILIRKTFVLHKNNANVNITRELDFKDEQVIIKDDLVILKPGPVQAEGADGGAETMNTPVKNEKADKRDDQTENPSVREEEEGKDEGKENLLKVSSRRADFVYHLCPAEACDRVFLKLGSTLTKHAVRFHLNEENVLEKTYMWARQKCTLCCRQMQFLQQYKDHMKRHLELPQYFCLHLDCEQRFATLQELRAHESTHNPFKPQCSFTACESLFPNLNSLYDHEWRHYIPTPQKADIEPGSNKLIRQNAEAPWKQRVKVEELWLQNKNSPRVETCITEAPVNESAITKSSQDSVFDTSDDGEKTGIEAANADTKTINGYDEEQREQVLHSSEKPAKRLKKERPERDPLNVKDHKDISVLSSAPLKKVEEPVIEQHKTFKPDDPAYVSLVKAPFIRPPPSTYLNESELSMRKRKADDAPVKKNMPWNQRKKENTSKVESGDTDAAVEPKIRHRCEKCLSSFGTVQELEKHKSLNTCSALFGFDSDDES